MATTFKSAIPLAAALLAIAALGSCGDQGTRAAGDTKNEIDAIAAEASRLLPDDFKGVCSGASVSNATAYDPGAKAHKVLYFGTYGDDLVDKSMSLPDDWTVRFSSESDTLRAVDLVVCAKRTAAQQVKVCDGYENDGKPTQNKVRWHTATYELSVREARTGRTLAEKTVEATDSKCPWFMNFDNDTDTVDDYARLSDSTVTDFLTPHIAR